MCANAYIRKGALLCESAHEAPTVLPCEVQEFFPDPLWVKLTDP
jgi:hypothetical protein